MRDRVELSPGTRFGGYTIVSVLGRGGMGVVYEADDPKRARRVALKVISRVHSSDESFMSRFRREGRAAEAVSHPNVVALLDAGEQSGSAYLVFELVSQGSLSDLLKERGALPWREAASLGAGVARGLAAVHAAGLVHRDVKPSNVLLDRRGPRELGEPKLADFGLVSAHSASLAVTHALTRTGEVVGTLEFMAPEQANASGSVTELADLYSLGALLYALLTGRPPFSGTGYALMKKHMTEAPRPPREEVAEVPERLESLVLALLEKRPEARPRSAASVARELDEIACQKLPGRSRLAAIVAVSLVVEAGVGAALLLAFARTQPESEAKPPRPAANTKAPAVAPDLAARKKAEARQLAEKARTLYEARQYDQAIEASTRAIDLDPTLGLAWMARGWSRRKKEQLDLAIADLTRCVELSPGLAIGWASRGAAHSDRGEPQRAVSDLTRALELEPGLAWVWSKRAAARAVLRENEGALADVARALALDPKDAEAWTTRGYVKKNGGDLEGALSDLRQAIEIDPTRPMTFLVRSELKRAMRDVEGALADAERAVQLSPCDAQAYATRAAARRRLGELDGAIADLGRAVELQPGFVLAWYGRAETRLDTGDIEGAIADATRALDVDPGVATVWCIRARARARKGDRAGAIADYQKALALEPNGTIADSARASLEGLRR